MKILLIQARELNDPAIKHEIDCFERAADQTIDALNFVERDITIEDVDNYDVLFFGGSGDFSIPGGGYDWHSALLDLMRDIVKRDQPTFASCFGFQALVAALDGDVQTDPERAEVGTFELTLTEAGKNDPLFRQLPTTFNAQLGHNDSAIDLPSSVTSLCGSERCVHQAIRVSDVIVATQFHPELTAADNVFRFLRYLQGYRPDLTPDQARREADAMHADSPEASALIRRYLERL